MSEECMCAEYEKLLKDLLRTLASMMPLVPDQESYLARAIRYSIEEIREALEGGEDESDTT